MDSKHKYPEILVDLSDLQSQALEQLDSYVKKLQNNGAHGIVLDLYRTNHLISSVHVPNEVQSFRENQIDQDDFLHLFEQYHSDDFTVLPRVFDPELVNWYDKISGTERVLTHGGDITYKRLLESLEKTDLTVFLTVKASQLKTIRQALEWLNNTEIMLIHGEYSTSPDTLDRFTILRNEFKKNIGLADPTGRFDRIKSLSSHPPSCWIPRPDPNREQTGWTSFEDLKSIKEQLTPDRSSTKSDSISDDSFQLDERDRLYQQNHRRSLMADRSLTAGSILSKEMVRELRPGNGLPAEEIDNIMGMLIQRPTDPQEIITY